MMHSGTVNNDINEDLVRHMILNSIRSVVKKFKSEYGSEIVIACDDRKSWRKTVFPNYKAKRAKSRSDSGLDWETIFRCIETVKQELIDYSPYKIIQVETAEADDIIGVLTTKYAMSEKIMIVSSDKDFIQLHKYNNVRQYSPILKKFIESDFSPQEHLKRLIISGDSSDGIPNILSPEDSFITGVRQKSIMEEKVKHWVNQSAEEFCDANALKRFEINQSLIDLSKIPQNIQESIIYTYDNTKPKARMKLMNYLISKRLTNLIEVINEF